MAYGDYNLRLQKGTEKAVTLWCITLADAWRIIHERTDTATTLVLDLHGVQTVVFSSGVTA